MSRSTTRLGALGPRGGVWNLAKSANFLSRLSIDKGKHVKKVPTGNPIHMQQSRYPCSVGRRIHRSRARAVDLGRSLHRARARSAGSQSWRGDSNSGPADYEGTWAPWSSCKILNLRQERPSLATWRTQSAHQGVPNRRRHRPRKRINREGGIVAKTEPKATIERSRRLRYVEGGFDCLVQLRNLVSIARTH